MTIQDLAYVVSNLLIGEDIPAQELTHIINDTFAFPVPLVQVDENLFALELFHGPTLSYKDIGARFLAHILRYLDTRPIHVLVATSGDSGGAIARAMHHLKGIHVHVLYPSRGITPIQRSQFATLGDNVEAIEVKGTYEQCQSLAMAAIADPELRQRFTLTSGNTLNIMRMMPQMFYFFHAVAQIPRDNHIPSPIITMAAGHLGNLTAGLSAFQMGLPVERFIAASVVGEQVPGNTPRINALFGGDDAAVGRIVEQRQFDLQQIDAAILDTYCSKNYLMHPHTAMAYLAAYECNKPSIFLATVHPAKDALRINEITGTNIAMPNELSALAELPYRITRMPARFQALKRHLMDEQQ